MSKFLNVLCNIISYLGFLIRHGTVLYLKHLAAIKVIGFDFNKYLLPLFMTSKGSVIPSDDTTYFRSAQEAAGFLRRLRL